MLSIEGNVVNIDGQARKRVEVGNDGIISAVGDVTGSADVVLDDELVFPGFVDVHVHARECADHSWDYKEDFATAGAAAINGGVVAFADMPNNPVPPVDEKSYADKDQLAKKAAVDVVLYAGIGPQTKPLYYINHGRDLYSTSRNVPYKVYMSQSVGDLFFSSLDDVERAISKYAGQNVSFHCEDPAILLANKNQPTHQARRPEVAEVSAIDFALMLIKKYNLKGKICHVSTTEGLAKITAVKNTGLPVTVEVSPNHLYFDETMMDDENRAMFQVNPPIRQSRRNRLYLLAALKKGDIDYLATDHSPHTVQEKEKGISGTPQLDTYGPFAAWLIKEHGFTPQDIARVCSFNPGQWFSQFCDVKYGKIEKGYAGSLTVLDMNHPIKIVKSMLKTKCGWSPFEGFQFPGKVAYTIIKGKVYKV